MEDTRPRLRTEDSDGTTDDRGASADGRATGVDCPLCGAGCESRRHVCQHLHTHHRKSELIDAYIAGLDADGRRS